MHAQLIYSRLKGFKYFLSLSGSEISFQSNLDRRDACSALLHLFLPVPLPADNPELIIPSSPRYTRQVINAGGQKKAKAGAKSTENMEEDPETEQCESVKRKKYLVRRIESSTWRDGETRRMTDVETSQGNRESTTSPSWSGGEEGGDRNSVNIYYL